MPLEPGTRLGPYEIAALIDIGGMGEVYRAIDTRLGRAVAIKVLPSRANDDARYSGRLEREAKVISSLAHPNICQLFDVGTHAGTPFLVMEFLDGEPLKHRLLRGPIASRQAAHIAAEVCSALACAHARNLVHHDVKPSNVMLLPSGAKLLDFGLARENRRSADTEALDGLTGEGSFVGTLDYMAPEQLSGRRGDPRTDIWGLGATLYEMLTGRPPFAGASRADVMASILTRTPDFDVISSVALQRILRKCLAKDPNERWQSAADLAEQLRTFDEEAPPVRGVRHVAAAAAVFVTLAAIGVTAWVWRGTRPAPSARLSIALPAGARYISDTRGLTISPDGRQVVFRVQRGSAMPEMYVRHLDNFELKRLDTAGAADPTFSPDGKWIAFADMLALKKAPLDDGAPVQLAGLRTRSRGISWSPDGTLYFAGIDEGIFAVSANGSDLHVVTAPDAGNDEENSHRTPYVLPDGKHLLLTIRSGRLTSFDGARIAALDIETGERRTIVEGGFHPSYLPSGHVVFVRENALWAAAFDLASLKVTSAPVRLIDGVMADPTTGVAQYAVAEHSGTLVYVRGEPRHERTELQVVNRDGVVTRTFVVNKLIDQFAVSPDGRRIAVQASAANDDIYSYDLGRDVLTQVTSQPGNEYSPSWTHDSTGIYFLSYKGMQRQSIDKAAPPALLIPATAERVTGALAQSPDGALIAYPVSGRADAPPTIKLGDSIAGATGSRPPPQSFTGMAPRFSPSGCCLAYVSVESGRTEVYVRDVASGRQVQASRDGGFEPRWSRDGSELHYRFKDAFFSVAVTLSPSLELGGPTLMFRKERIRSWDVTRDGFVLLGAVEHPLVDAGINVVPDWMDEVRARVRVR